MKGERIRKMKKIIKRKERKSEITKEKQNKGEDYQDDYQKIEGMKGIQEERRIRRTKERIGQKGKERKRGRKWEKSGRRNMRQ